jgi:hypothetical protein
VPAWQQPQLIIVITVLYGIFRLLSCLLLLLLLLLRLLLLA